MAVKSGGQEDAEAAVAVSGIPSLLSLLKRWHGRIAAVSGARNRLHSSGQQRRAFSLCAADDVPALVWLLAFSSNAA